MLNVFKKVDKSRHGVGGGKGKSLEPPKNLPDLARDLYERELIATGRTDSPVINPDSTTQTKDSIQTMQMSSSTQSMQSNSKPILEPSKESVPRLDLSLVRQHLEASQSAISSPSSIVNYSAQPTISVQPQQTQSTVQPTFVQSKPAIPQSASQTNIIPQSFSQSLIHENVANNSTSDGIRGAKVANVNISNNIGDMLNSINSIDDSTGFFKEFEEYVRNNGLDNDVVDDLLTKNWLDHLLFYHTTKGEDMPFYASSAELSHAVKLKLEDLQSLERNWIVNKQKVDLLKKVGSALESDIHLKSEELKKLMIESKRRGGVVKSTDFFQLIKPRTADSAPKNVESASSSTQSFVQSYAPPVHSPMSHQPPIALKYVLTKYVVNDASKYFYASNGQVFKSLNDLMNGLESIDVNTFNHHVTAEKNDFSNWIKGVFGDFKLSDAIRSLDDRETLWYFLRNNTI